MWDYSTDIDLSTLLDEDRPTIIFKHSNRCSISSVALQRMLKHQMEFDKNAKFILVDVVENRATSLKIAKELDIDHASPQVIIIKNKKVVHVESHMGIRPTTVLAYL